VTFCLSRRERKEKANPLSFTNSDEAPTDICPRFLAANRHSFRNQAFGSGPFRHLGDVPVKFRIHFAALLVKLPSLFPGEWDMQRSSNISFTQTWSPVPLAHLPSNIGSTDRQLWKLNPVNRFYQQVESLCYWLLAFSGIFAVLYSISVFLR
jgi:hypothetical protein